MLTLLQGVLTAGIPFLKQWWVGKQEEAKRKLEIKQQVVATKQQILLETAKSSITNTSERIKQMANSFKDEFTMIVIFWPFVTSIISPYIDLYFALKTSSYQQGMLAEASLAAIQSLNQFPLWYTLIVILMILYSWGASKEVIEKFFDMFNFRKK
tara:strand:- start:10728 stop:11192 length:465 start_codon:yes stop_codon:yes gene_type:complete